MGLHFSRIWERMFGKKEMRILMVGLDAAGKVCSNNNNNIIVKIVINIIILYYTNTYNIYRQQFYTS
jgi:hypothetical protein